MGNHLIPKMKRFQHRILIFCQFVQTMDILSEFLDFIHEPYLRIDGGTDSEVRIDSLSDFNSTGTKYDVFLLSTRACGLGLNLYSADTVILFDSDWNPQQDLQATARCHRIGQKREVRVFRLIADETIEEAIYDRAQKKLDLERKAIECGKFDFSISGAERKEFLTQILKERDIKCNKYESSIERTKLNELLSRTEAEWKEFERMDAVNTYLPLSKEKKFPNWLEEIKTASDPKEKLPNKRVRKQVSYKESDYWKSILEKQCLEENDDNEDDDDEEKQKKKKKNIKKRKRKQMDDDDNENENDENKKRRKVQA